MNRTFYITFAASVFFAVAFVVLAYLTRTSRATVQRIREVTYRGRELRHSMPAGKSASQKFFDAIRQFRSFIGLANAEDIPQRLANAGYKNRHASDVYGAARILLPLLGLIAALTLPWAQLFWVMALPAIGFIAPNIVLSRRIKARREKIRRSIPDAVDLLVICVDAGLGIDQALLRVSQELGISHPEITEELLQINREQRAGKPRIQAWADMAKRTELDDINAFTSMLMQTDRFGTPIARALSTFSDTIRLRRRQLAEQAAAKTTIKIIFPLVLFIFPSMFIVLLAPAVLSIMRSVAL